MRCSFSAKRSISAEKQKISKKLKTLPQDFEETPDRYSLKISKHRVGKLRLSCRRELSGGEERGIVTG